MRTMSQKIITIEQETINTLARGCPWNNPVAVALKEQAFPEARQILVHTEEDIYVDGMPILPSLSMIRFIKDWNAGRKVVPTVLGYSCE